MPNFIGTDEAGYGPNLGPLTVTGCLWSVPERDSDLYTLLGSCIKAASSRTRDDRLLVADSKVVYKPSGSIKTLETNVLSFVAATTGKIPATLTELMKLIGVDWFEQPGRRKRAKEIVWMTGRDLALPMKADVDKIYEQAARLDEAFIAAGVSLDAINCAAVFPEDFNDRLDEFGNKASLLSAQTLQIVSQLIDPELCTAGHIRIVCDKHGGRSKYLDLISQYLTDGLVSIGEESRELSTYRWSETNRNIEARFQARGESFLPTALASMVSKYVRESYMQLWNEFWQLRIPELRPTKGYPQDAKRFKKEIEAVQAELGISDHSIWRRK